MNLDLFSDSYIKIARSSMHFEPAVWAMKGDLRWTSSRQDYWSRGLLLGWSWSKQCSSCHRSCLRRDCLHVFQNLRCPSFSNISQICQGPELFVCQEMLLVSSRFLKTFYLYTLSVVFIKPRLESTELWCCSIDGQQFLISELCTMKRTGGGQQKKWYAKHFQRRMEQVRA